jgi:hypothetical protein
LDYTLRRYSCQNLVLPHSSASPHLSCLMIIEKIVKLPALMGGASR